MTFEVFYAPEASDDIDQAFEWFSARAPAVAAACAIAHEIDRLLATPTTRPCFPERSDIGRSGYVWVGLKPDTTSSVFCPGRGDW